MVMLSAEVVGVEAFAERARGTGSSLRRSLHDSLTRFMIRAQASVKRDKLSGGTPLHRRSGKLSRSVHYAVEDVRGGAVEGVLAAGKEVPYARTHEFGGTFIVPAHVRSRAKLHGRVVSTSRFFRASRTERRLGGETFSVLVKAHTVTFPERSFLRSTLREMSPEFVRTVRQATLEGLRPA